MYSDCESPTMSSDLNYNTTFYQPITSYHEPPPVDYAFLSFLINENQKTYRLRSDHLSEKAHFLRKKRLPSRPKKVRWRKG